jgi:hypothetical protein
LESLNVFTTGVEKSVACEEWRGLCVIDKMNGLINGPFVLRSSLRPPPADRLRRAFLPDLSEIGSSNMAALDSSNMAAR